eukprot:PITA_32275
MSTSLMNYDNIIIGGDLNFSLGHVESWGNGAQTDPLMEYFEHLMDNNNLMNIDSAKIQPTWQNRRIGEDALAKRLDRFIIKAPLVERLDIIRQWVGSGGISNHFPIYLEIMNSNYKPNSPFKFNSAWLVEEELHKIVMEFEIHCGHDNNFTSTEVIANNLARIKYRTIIWAKEKKKRDEDTILKIDDDILEMEGTSNASYSSLERKEHLINLETKKIRLLRWQEETWRIKSKVIWLKAGDENLKFFQQCAKGRKLTETLPRFVEAIEEEELNKPVTLGEIEAVLKWFKRDKSLGPNRWPIEFYLTFFNHIGADLLIAIEKCKRSGNMREGFNSIFIALIPNADNPQTFDDYRPISLCNCIYKIISKIIAIYIKPILSKMISNENFAFLNHRQIHEAIRTAQEGIHSMKLKNTKSNILKIDLTKAFDRAS